MFLPYILKLWKNRIQTGIPKSYEIAVRAIGRRTYHRFAMPKRRSELIALRSYHIARRDILGKMSDHSRLSCQDSGNGR